MHKIILKDIIETQFAVRDIVDIKCNGGTLYGIRVKDLLEDLKYKTLLQQEVTGMTKEYNIHGYKPEKWTEYEIRIDYPIEKFDEVYEEVCENA